MTLLSIEQIISVDDRKTTDVPCPEWGGEVRLRSLTGSERDELEHSQRRRANAMPDNRGLRKRLIRMSAINKDGSPMFDEKTIKELERKNAAVLDRLFGEAMKLAGLSDDDVEVLEKNSEADPDSASE